MNFFKRIGRACQKAWDDVTGKTVRNQKNAYYDAANRYNAFASEAQNTIDHLSRQLAQTAATMRSLEEQQYYHQTMTGGSLHQRAEEYESSLANMEARKSEVLSEAGSLSRVFEEFKKKAPALESRINEVQQLPGAFQSSFDEVTRQKERLKGLTPEEAEGYIKKHFEDVENLKTKRSDTETKIREAMAGITRDRKDLVSQQNKLEQRLDSYKSSQDRLVQESNYFTHKRSSLEQTIKEYRDRAESLAKEQTHVKAGLTAQEKQLKDYIASSQARLDSLAGETNWRADKYKSAARTTGLLQGGLVGLATFGLGSGLGALAGTGSSGAGILSSIGTGLKYGSLALGIGTFLNHTARAGAASGVGRVDLAADNPRNYDLSHLARYGLGSPKISIPELGGLKQSLSHFDMPMVPKLKDLPSLSHTLGKIVSLKDIEQLALGLPSMTSASGKKYSTEVLYNPEFIKKLKKVSRSLGRTYLTGQQRLQAVA